MGPFPARAPKLFFHLLSDILPGSVAWLLIDDMIKVAAASFPASQPRCKEDAGLPRPAAETMARRQLHGVVFFNGTGGGAGGRRSENCSTLGAAKRFGGGWSGWKILMTKLAEMRPGNSTAIAVCKSWSKTGTF